MRTLKSVLANFDRFFQRNSIGATSIEPFECVLPLCFTCNSRRMVVLSCAQMLFAIVVAVNCHAAPAITL
jgi:hypothetical protein